MWTLLLARSSDPPGTFFDRRQLDSGQIKVGRSARTSDLVLPDDQGFVSREHCTISVVGLDVFVVDTSTNGVALNRGDARIAPNVPVAIRPDDRLLIGDFVVTLKTADTAAGISLAPPTLGIPMGSDSLPQPNLWDDGPSGSIWGDDAPSSAVHDFLGEAMNDFLSPASRAAQAGSARTFDLGDPLEHAFSRPILADPLPAPADFGIPEDWATAGPGSAADQPPSGAPDPFAVPSPMRQQSGSAVAATTLDPFDLSAPLEAESHAAVQPAAEPLAQRGQGLASLAAAAPVALPSGDAWAAFLEGADLPGDDLRLAPDAMRRLGVFYRQTVLGLWDIIQDRASFKDEFRVERTQLSMGRNNPLKHLQPVEAAKVLLGDIALPGFMDSEEAIRTAFEDIKKHQLAMLAGVQKALAAVFERLSPAEIEKIVEKAGGGRKGMPFGRGIDRWSVYQTLFEALRKDATSNANGVMSVAFREGYEEFLKSA